MKSKVAILTPTYKRSIDVLDRCIRTVQYQTYGIDNISHFICHDGIDSDKETEFNNYSKNNNWINVKYLQSEKNTNNFGAGVRQYLLDNFITKDYDYVVHLDDDNILYPDFVMEHVNALQDNPDKHFSICNILHCGPLPEHFKNVPAVVTGVPPVYRNIDTLQIMVRTNAMKKCGWIQKTGIDGYCNDGYTYEKLGKMFDWIHIPKILAVHT